MKSVILETARETWGKKLEAIKPWMTQEILDLINKRNKLDKLSYSQIYKNLKREIRRKCREAKDRKIMEECDYMQALEESNNNRELYQRIKKFNKKPRIQSNNKLLSRGDIIIAQRDQAKRWKEYIEEIYKGEKVQEADEDDGLKEERIAREEIMKAMNSLRSNTARVIASTAPS